MQLVTRLDSTVGWSESANCLWIWAQRVSFAGDVIVSEMLDES